MKKKGFTLIELMAVVAIIGVLLGLIMSAAANSIKVARKQKTATICKVVGIAQLNETEQLHNVPLMITVGFDRNDATRNVIRGYAAKSGAQAAPSAVPAASPAAVAAGAGAAPWAR